MTQRGEFSKLSNAAGMDVMESLRRAPTLFALKAGFMKPQRGSTRLWAKENWGRATIERLVRYDQVDIGA